MNIILRMGFLNCVYFEWFLKWGGYVIKSLDRYVSIFVGRKLLEFFIYILNLFFLISFLYMFKMYIFGLMCVYIYI